MMTRSRYKSARTRWKHLPDEESEPLWDQLHQACAIYAYEHIVELQVSAARLGSKVFKVDEI